MNDRERILMTILRKMKFTQMLCLHGWKEEQFKNTLRFEHGDNDEYVHFGGYDDRRIRKGDLVLADSARISDWTVGWVEEVYSDEHMLIREIGTKRLCNYSNEGFTRIVIDHSLIREGAEYKLQQKILKAFYRGNKYNYRYGGIEFLEGRTVRIFIREAFGGIIHESVPFSFDMHWTKKTTIKEILERMIENGYGTREFKITEVKI